MKDEQRVSGSVLFVSGFFGASFILKAVALAPFPVMEKLLTHNTLSWVLVAATVSLGLPQPCAEILIAVVVLIRPVIEEVVCHVRHKRFGTDFCE